MQQVKILMDLYDSDGDTLVVPANVVVPLSKHPEAGEVIKYEEQWIAVFPDEYEIILSWS